MYALQERRPTLQAVPVLDGSYCSLQTVINTRVEATAVGASYARQTFKVAVELTKPNRYQPEMDSCLVWLTLPRRAVSTRAQIEDFVAKEFPRWKLLDWSPFPQPEPDYSGCPF